MVIYLLVLFIVAVSAIISLSFMYRQRFWIAIVPSIVLCFFIGLRDKIGADWDAYSDITDSFRNVDLSSFVLFLPEPLYSYVNWMSVKLGYDVHLVNAICALIVIGAILRFSFLVDINPSLLIFLATPYLLFVVGMGYTRQSVAISLGFLGLGNLIHGRKKMFYLYILLAMGFHVSAIFLLIFRWLKNWKHIFWAAPVIGAGIYVSSQSIFIKYGELYIQDAGELQSSGIWFRISFLLFGSFMLIMQRKQWKGEPELFSLLKVGCALTLVLIPVGIVLSTLADRTCLYLFFLYLIPLGRSIRFSSPWSKGITLLSVFVINFLCFFVWFGISSFAAQAWIPYKMIWPGIGE
jgi:hypothetical protein